MYRPHQKFTKHCRWCGKPYQAFQPWDRDGFDTKACKQALYRARKKHVTSQKTRPLS